MSLNKAETLRENEIKDFGFVLGYKCLRNSIHLDVCLLPITYVHKQAPSLEKQEYSFGHEPMVSFQIQPPSFLTPKPVPRSLRREHSSFPKTLLPACLHRSRKQTPSCQPRPSNYSPSHFQIHSDAEPIHAPLIPATCSKGSHPFWSRPP